MLPLVLPPDLKAPDDQYVKDASDDQLQHSNPKSRRPGYDNVSTLTKYGFFSDIGSTDRLSKMSKVKKPPPKIKIQKSLNGSRRHMELSPIGLPVTGYIILHFVKNQQFLYRLPCRYVGLIMKIKA
ncbi:hypothetical protein E5288_WYG001346 [Bos mutus]|uniref:Uncharacterized protein n=1 Tax=Bos mutus TaxID=72004 RepID=A0A6B0RCG6_9CETA|nr:hypothetical protein [Bos mutus]